MTVFAARRAEEFNTLVEGTSAGSSRDARYAEFVEIVAQLRDVAPVEPRPDFTLSLREELMVAADTLLLPSEDTQRLTLPPRRTARDRRVAAVVGGLAIVGASTSLAVAAQSALPGEMLYPLKRVMENAETGIRMSDEAKGASLLSNATDRLDELSALSRTGGLGEGAAIASTLTTFSDQAMAASDLLLTDYAKTGDERSIEELRDFTATSMQTLAQLEALLPEEAHDELAYAAQVLGEIDAAASKACPSCAGGIGQIPPVLMSAGQLAEPDVVIVRSPLLTGEEPKGGGKNGGKQGDGNKGGKQGDDGPLGGAGLNTPDTGGGGGSTGGGRWLRQPARRPDRPAHRRPGWRRKRLQRRDHRHPRGRRRHRRRRRGPARPPLTSPTARARAPGRCPGTPCRASSAVSRASAGWSRAPGR